MILTDYLLSEHNISWDYAKQVGVDNGVIRLPETPDFDLTNMSHWKSVYKNFTDFGIKPVVIEPLPNCVHDHIKTGDEKRDESIEKVIKMFPIMKELGIHTICFNFMAYIGWLRTSSTVKERGDALVTGFNMNDFKCADDVKITEEELWRNYEYFIKAVIPYAEENDIYLGLHPDDPPVARLGGVSRIMTSFESIYRACHITESPNIGVTMCQACYCEMGEDLEKVIRVFSKENKIFFIHFRDIVGNKFNFHESFHDDGQTDMAGILKLYYDLGLNVPIRVDHVPTMAGETTDTPGYAAVGRLYAIGYLKGLMEAIEKGI
ncbi:MAG: mannonate dehydratase [Monoglobaceae bacterium]